MKNLSIAFKTVFKDPLYLFTFLSLSFNLLAVYYFIFSQTTSFKIFFDSNVAIYNWLSIVLTIVICFLFGISFTFLIWQWRQKLAENPAHFGNNIIGVFLGAVSTGCPTCGAYLLSLLGVAGGLAAFPFQGLEIKAFSMALLGLSVFASASVIALKDCPAPKSEDEKTLFGFENGKLAFNFSKKTIVPILPALLGFCLLFLTAYLPLISSKYGFGFNFQKTAPASLTNSSSSQNNLPQATQQVLDEINPPDGFTMNATYGDIGPKLIADGAIDFPKMKALYEQNGVPLSDDEIKILTQGSDEKITVGPKNAYFLLNLLWALGLANNNPILDNGPMMKYGKGQIGNFASTGGWTLGTKKATDLYSKFAIISLTPDQQKIVEDFADNAYRPCCSNPASFPDCNHGMAALALAELMASQGASSADIFQAFKYVNAFWFQQTYFDIATYFKAKEGKDWSQVDAREVAGKDYATPQGWNRVRNWLKANNLLQETPSGGSGCGA